jgi:hypothetical protein
MLNDVAVRVEFNLVNLVAPKMITAESKWLHVHNCYLAFVDQIPVNTTY